MNTKPTVIDRFVGYGIDRAAYAITHWNKAFPSRSQRALPPYVGDDDYGSYDTSLNGGNETALRHRALTLSWIYADIDLIAKEFSSAGFGVKEQKGEDVSDIVNHPFETLLSNPNDEMTGAFLLQYTAWWMQLRGKAFWYLAPAKGNSNEIAEIWPLPADKVEVVKGKTTFIDHYTYKLRRGTKIKLNPDYVVYFRFPNPYDLWDGLAPLDAALSPLEIDQAEAKWQRDTYVNGRGIPASVLMLSEKMGDRDFAVAAQRIREDFEQGRKLAIARGSDLKVASIGITPQQLGLIESRQFTRDEIDTVFLGLAYHGFSSETGIVVADKILKEKKIYPMHVLMAGQMTTQLVRPFYGDEFLLEFDDIRPQDRSLDIQEFDTYSRVMTLNEARKERKLDDYENDLFPELGDMPVKLATDPSFVLAYFPPAVQSPPQNLLGLPAPISDNGIGSLPQLDTPKNQTENAAERGTGDMTEVNAPPADQNTVKGGVGSGNPAPGQGRGVGKPDGSSSPKVRAKLVDLPNGKVRIKEKNVIYDVSYAFELPEAQNDLKYKLWLVEVHRVSQTLMGTSLAQYPTKVRRKALRALYDQDFAPQDAVRKWNSDQKSISIIVSKRKRGRPRKDSTGIIPIKGGEGSGNRGHAGRPGEVGGSATTRIGITSQSTRNPITNQQVYRDMAKFENELRAIDGVINVDIKPGRGAWLGGGEATWVVTYDGNGEAIKLLARTGIGKDQDGILLYATHELQYGVKSIYVDHMFDSVSPVRRGEIETILAAEGFQGWTWSRVGGRTTLRLVSVPQWGGDPVVDRLLAEKLGMRFSFDSSYTQSIHEVNVSVMNKPGKGEPTYQSFLESK